MKKIIVILFAFCIFESCNKEQKQPNAQQITTENVRYKLFPTDNIWTFLKLDTSNGLIWQVQYSVNNDYRGEVVLNSQTLVEGDAAKNGRFILYPTQNMYNFILLDQKDGRIWQVQWSMEDGSRMVIPIMR
ncbi:MAG: hypothetical protein IJ183_00920 [Prevotella sp.]|nr:hypothetical protein [Prevotella sp.]